MKMNRELARKRAIELVSQMTVEEKAGQFQGMRIIGQVLIPGIIGPAIGAWVLRDAEMVLNNDGTYSFLPNENIFLAAFVVAAALCVTLALIFRISRLGHYESST